MDPETHWGPRKIEQLETALRRYVVIPYDRDLAWARARVVAACEERCARCPPGDAGSPLPLCATMCRC